MRMANIQELCKFFQTKSWMSSTRTYRKEEKEENGKVAL